MSTKRKIADYDLPFDAVLASIRETDRERNPNIERVDNCILKNGPRAYKVATIFYIRDRVTGEFHHRELRLEQYEKTKERGWEVDDKRSININDEEDNQIGKLFDFLASVPGINQQGDYLVINPERIDDCFQQVLEAVSSNGKAQLLAEVLTLSERNPEVTSALIELASQNPEQSQALAAALNIGRFSAALGELKELIEQNAQEKVYQSVLQNNPWMFGSEYSELLDRRAWTTDEQLDFPLRRTVDDCLEIVEIKRPLGGEPLFVKDRSRSVLYPRSELSEALGQVMHYVELTETAADRIWRRYGMRVSKVRATVIIGRDGDDEQLEALRRLNSHLHRVEVLTFDQLVKIAGRVLTILEEKCLPRSQDEAV